MIDTHQHKVRGLISSCITATLCSCFIATATETNALASWFVIPGLVWGNATNGIRAGITDRDPGVKGVAVFVARPTNSTSRAFGEAGYSRYFAPPSGKFANVELRTAEGLIVSPVRGRTLVGDLPTEIPLKDLPRYPIRGTRQRGSGGELKNWLFENPATLKVFSIQDFYRISKEGNYTLTVWPTIYKFGTNTAYVSRIDLPCVTTKIHLKPQEPVLNLTGQP